LNKKASLKVLKIFTLIYLDSKF